MVALKHDSEVAWWFGAMVLWLDGGVVDWCCRDSAAWLFCGMMATNSPPQWPLRDWRV